MTQTATGEARETETIHDILSRFAKAAVRAHFPEADRDGNPLLARFFFDNGRLPFIGDEVKPWEYRGWLVPYVQMCEAHPQISPRYNYVLRTLDAGRLLDEPLPQIHFVGETSAQTKPGMKMLETCLDRVEYASGSWNGIREFCEWLGYALGVTGERSKLSEDVQEFLYRTFNLEHLLLNPTDYLGQILCETNHGKKNGFYPTPLCIVQMMGQMLCADEKRDRRSETTCDPCVGTGRMLLVASNYSMRLFGMDIDYLCCLITKINLALYAPWFYIPDALHGGADEAETTVETAIEIKDALAPSNEQTEPISTETETENSELSLFERMRIEKENKQRRRTFSTAIEEQPSLFDFQGDKKIKL